jgi:putative OPT family oligopeptide transporter
MEKKVSAVTPSESSASESVQPYIPAATVLPEITIKAFVISVILAILMAAANAYLGLKIGMTVSATIPAAVISMAILKLFRQSNILENNIVQTAASAGEAIAAAVVFTLPALLIMGYWTEIPFFTTLAIVAIGGTLGVLFSIPLRRAFVVESELKFPEGIATGEVLKAGDGGVKGATKDLIMGGLFAALVKLCQSGFFLIEESVGYWVRKGKTVIGAEGGFSLVLVGAGYIIGIGVGISMLVGAVLAWIIGVPLYGYINGIPEGMPAFDAAMMIWSKNIRVMGVGTMVVGGLWTMIKLIDPIKRAVQFSLETILQAKNGAATKILRTEHDVPMVYVLVGIVVLMVPLGYIFHDILTCCNLEITSGLHWLTVIVMTIFAVIFGFIISAIGGYMAGIVGSSNNPLSAVTIMGIIAAAILLTVLLGSQFDFSTATTKVMSVAAMTIVLVAVMANASAISGDNLQDLKSGQIVGATPWKQQVMLVVGVLAAAAVITPILDVLYNAYGIGTALPRPDMDPAEALNAPTATVMSQLTMAIFTGSMNWFMFSLGAGFALLLICHELYMKKCGKSFRIPVLGVAVGIYLPLSIIFPIFLGGLVHYLAEKRIDKNREILGVNFADKAKQVRQRGLLFSSGLIAGEAIMGIFLAVPFAAAQSTQIFSLRPADFGTMATVLGAAIFFAVTYYLYHIGSKMRNTA